MQGKIQLFAGRESDFFRNRLTHSLEVAQIAESIAHKVNHEHAYFRKNPIEARVCLTAGLVHDIGHPPFGHNGEYALDAKMRAYGGFEGNAQTLRILTRLEKKRRAEPCEPPPVDGRMGLNLTYRSLAAALKYDREIPNVRAHEDKLAKGYYSDDGEIVTKIKEHVDPDWSAGKVPFKTIECSIMDIADDIAYSTYDLEDSLKAGFLSPAAILSSSEELLSRVATKVTTATQLHCSPTDVLEVFSDMFKGLAEPEGKHEDDSALYNMVLAIQRSNELASDGYLRTDLTSQLVGEFIEGIRVNLNRKHPALSAVVLEGSIHRKVEILKNYTYEATITSSRYKVAEFRGAEVVGGIFDALATEKGHLLLPEDVRRLYIDYEANASARMRVICDFIAGMTDRYALEFYGRLHSDSGESIFKPL